MKSYKAAPILLVGLGLLIALTAITGAGSLKRARDAYRDVTALNDKYRRAERALSAVGTSIYVGGLLARDYLLDPSNLEAPEYRKRLLDQRSTMEQAFRDLDQILPDERGSQLKRLRAEEQGYWDAMDPLFEWTPEQKAAQSRVFLRREILPRRDAALALARETASIAETNLERQRAEIDNRQIALAAFIRRMLAVTVLVGLAVAAVTFGWIARLETRSQEQRQRTEIAESELRRLSRQLVQAQEDERKSISRELHDEVGQMLTALRMEVGSLQELRAAPQSLFNEHLESAKRLTEQSLRALRDIAMGLRPSMLDDLGLGPAIQWQARKFSKHTGIPVNVHIEGLPTSLADRRRTCVYRVVQEALTNCARHARAKTIDVNVLNQNERLLVSVKDDGVGFNPSAVRGKGLGLLGIQERVMELGGELNVLSQPQKGAAVTATIPLGDEEAPANVHSHPIGG